MLNLTASIRKTWRIRGECYRHSNLISAFEILLKRPSSDTVRSSTYSYSIRDKTNIPFEQVSSMTIEESVGSLQHRGTPDYSANPHLNVLKIFFSFLENEGPLNGQVNPMKEMKLLRRRKKIRPVLRPYPLPLLRPIGYFPWLK